MKKIKQTKIILLSLISFLTLHSTSSFGSARMFINHDTKVLEFHSHLYLYGSQASESVATASAEEIMTMWNAHSERAFNFPFLGDYRVKFLVDWEIISVDKARELMAKETDCKNNYVRVESPEGFVTEQTRSKWVDNNSIEGDPINAAFFNTKDDLGNSTTIAHEYGHSLGLEHGEGQVQGQPGIMAARGTLVDAIYQSDPTAKQGELGGTIDPYKRVVLRSDVQKVLDGIMNIQHVGVVFDDDGGSVLGRPIDPNCIGEVLPLYFDEFGESSDP